MLLSGVVIIELKFFDDDDAIKRYLVEKASIERALEVFYSCLVPSDVLVRLTLARVCRVFCRKYKEEVGLCTFLVMAV